MVFCCHFGNSVEKTAMILSHLYIIGLKIVQRDIQGGRTYVMITFVSNENNLGPDDKIRYIWGFKGPIFILKSAAGPH